MITLHPSNKLRGRQEGRRERERRERGEGRRGVGEEGGAGYYFDDQLQLSCRPCNYVYLSEEGKKKNKKKERRRGKEEGKIS